MDVPTSGGQVADLVARNTRKYSPGHSPRGTFQGVRTPRVSRPCPRPGAQAGRGATDPRAAPACRATARVPHLPRRRGGSRVAAGRGWVESTAAEVRAPHPLLAGRGQAEGVTRPGSGARRSRPCGVVLPCDSVSLPLVSCQKTHGAAEEAQMSETHGAGVDVVCLLYTSPSPRDRQKSRMPSSA